LLTTVYPMVRLS